MTPEPGRLDHVPRRAPRPRPGAARRRRARAEARRAARREAAGARRHRPRARSSSARCARSASARCPRPTGPAGCASSPASCCDDARGVAARRTARAGARPRRSAGPPRGAHRPGPAAGARPGPAAPRWSCSPRCAPATPTPTSRCPAILRRAPAARPRRRRWPPSWATARCAPAACSTRSSRRAPTGRSCEVEPALLDALRLGAYQLLRTRVPPHAAVDTTVELVRVEAGSRSAGFVNAVLRRVGERDEAAWVQRLAPDAAEDPVGHAAFAHAHPRWIAQAFADALGRRRPSWTRRWPPTTPGPPCTCSPGPARSPPRSWRWSPAARRRRTRPTACTWSRAAATSGELDAVARGPGHRAGRGQPARGARRSPGRR